jgi:hypothetical protein
MKQAVHAMRPPFPKRERRSHGFERKTGWPTDSSHGMDRPVLDVVKPFEG